MSAHTHIKCERHGMHSMAAALPGVTHICINGATSSQGFIGVEVLGGNVSKLDVAVRGPADVTAVEGDWDIGRLARIGHGQVVCIVE